MCDSISNSSGYGAGEGAYGGLGIGNPGSYGGTNYLGSTSPSSGNHDGIYLTSSGDQHSPGEGSLSRQGANEVPGVNSPGSYCSVSDLYSATLETSSPKDEKAVSEEKKESKDAPEKHACGNCHGIWSKPEKVKESLYDAAVEGVFAGVGAYKVSKQPVASLGVGLSAAGVSLAKDVIKHPEDFAVEKGAVQKAQEQLERNYNATRGTIDQLRKCH